jgi:hypothetical protein
MWPGRRVRRVAPSTRTSDEGRAMPRYLVERALPTDAAEGVTWVHPYVSEDRRKTFDVDDADTPEAIRRVLDPSTT